MAKSGLNTERTEGTEEGGEAVRIATLGGIG